MFCRFCGQELADAARFCADCGHPTQLNEEQTRIYTPNAAKKSKRKKMWLFTATGLVIISLIFGSACLLLTPQVKLSYDWGTPISHIAKNETVIDKGNDYLLCEDPYHKVDKLDDLEYSIVKYKFDSSGNLYKIEYEYMYEDLSVRERREAAEKIYGEKYFTIDHKVSDYYSTNVWWIGDTVIVLSWSGVSYYDSDYYLDVLQYHPDYSEELLEFFNKR